jgi:hypothetical protein
MRLHEMASVLRSKNAGPAVVTFDVVFRSPEDFARAERSDSFAVENVCRALKVDVSDVLFVGFIKQALAYKISVIRPYVSGSREDRDVYGCAQHPGLNDLEVN